MESSTKQLARHPFKIGQRIADRYTVRGFLGSGTMGWVLKVSDEALDGAPVALKILYPHLSRDRNCVERFRAEVVLARQLSHPSIIHVHDLSESADGELFLAMEFIDGTNLAEILADRRGKGLPFDEAMFILVRVAEGLLYAHQQGIVHRDLKPANILIGADGAVKLSDFGLAKSFQQEFGLTRTGEALGTPLYMAPEQFNDAAVDQRSDIYAFGILAFETLAGNPPFRDEGFFELARHHNESPLPPLTTASSAAPQWLQELIQQCCAKAPADRPLSVADFLPVLQQQLPLQAQLRHTLARKRRARRLTRRGQMRGFVVAAILLVVAIFEAGYAQQNFRTFVASNVLAFEFDVGVELTPLKKLLRIEGSLLRPHSAFELIRSRRIRDLESMLTACSLVRLENPRRFPMLAMIRDEKGATVLHRAMETNSAEMVNPFLAAEVDFSKRDAAGDNVVTAAVRNHWLKSLRALHSNRRFNPEIPAKDGDRPLHLAVKNRDLLTIELLLHKYANPDARNRAGLAPLHLAIDAGDIGVVRQLLKLGGPDLSIQDPRGRTPLIYLLTGDQDREKLVEIASLLLDEVDRAADLDARDHEGRTALMYAAMRGEEALVARLLQRGADRSARDQSGTSALEHGAPYPEIVRMLTASADDAR